MVKLGFIHKAYQIYHDNLNRRPLTVQALTGIAISAFGDLLVQFYFDDQINKYSVRRGIVVGIYAGLEISVEAWFWYPLLDIHYGHCMTAMNAIKKIMADQVLYAPLETMFYMWWTNKLEGRSEDIDEKLNRDFNATMILNYLYWIPTSFALYYYVPLQYRAITTSIFTFVWDTFMSYAAHNNLKQRCDKLFDFWKEKTVN